MIETQNTGTASSPSLLWHYTFGLHWPLIISKGVIQQVGQSGEFPVADAERVVWFSKNQSWEPTVRKGHPKNGQLMTFNELEELFGVFRIGVERETAPTNWKEFQSRKGAVPRLNVLAKVGRPWGANPKDWFISERPVTQDKWKATQFYLRGRWVDIETRFTNTLSSAA